MKTIKIVGLVFSIIATILTIIGLWVSFGPVLDFLYDIVLILGIIGGIVCGSLKVWWAATLAVYGMDTYTWFGLFCKFTLGTGLVGLIFVLGVMGFPAVFALIGFFGYLDTM